jgi:superfamily II DNA or RNA helicase
MRGVKFVSDPSELSKLRLERARSEKFRIEPVRGGDALARRFRVFSESRRRYLVELRDVAHPVNFCECPDYGVNLLGTCKHIQAVASRFFRRARTARPRRRRGALVYLSRLDAPRVMFHPLGPLSPRARAVRDAFFRDDGSLAAGDPDTLERLLKACSGDGVRVGDEVRHHLEALRIRRDWEDTFRALDAKISSTPNLLTVPLYPYQLEGVRHLLRRRRAVLADEMGLGKTAQAIAAATLLAREGLTRRILVVCPASLKHQWEKEIRRFSGGATALVSGPPRARHELYRSGPLFTIVNYELVYHDREFLRDSGISWDLVILDEAQRIKNWRAKTSDAIKDLRGRSRFAFVLTGTPFENNIEELFSVCQFVDPTVLGPLWKFYDRHFQLDDKGHALGYRNLDELRRRIEPVFLRRAKEEVSLQLPPKVVNTYYVELNPAQREAHDSWMQNAARLMNIMKRRPLLPKERERLMMYLLMARRACDDSGMAKGDPSASPKIKELERLLEETVQGGGRKAILFSEWVDMLDLASTLLRRRRIGHVYLHGGVPSSARGRLVEQFREDPACRVFLSTDAGGVGLNLQPASLVINLDLPWNPARLEQRIGRAHRIGQRNPVQVVNLVAEDCIEQRIEGILGGKRELFEAVFGRDEGATEIALSSSAGPAQELVRKLVGEEEWAEGGGKVSPPAIDRSRTFEEALAAALGPGRFELLRLPRPQDGVSALVAIDNPPPDADERVARAAAAMGEAPPAIVAKEVLSTVRALVPPPLPAAPSKPPPPAAIGRALAAARCLRDSGFTAEAIAQVGRALLGSLGGLLERHGVPVPSPAQIPLAARRGLIGRPSVPRALVDRALAALAWSQASDGAAGAVTLDDATANELFAEAEGILGELDACAAG